MHFAYQHSEYARQRLVGADIQRRCSYEILPERHVEKWPWRLAHALVLRVGGHTDNSCPPAVHPESTTDRILTVPVKRHHSSIDDGYQRRVFIVSACELTAGEKRDP